MKQRNRIVLEGELYIFQRGDVRNSQRWYCSYKLHGIERIYRSLGVVSQERASKLARRELDQAETNLDLYGPSAVVGANRIRDAVQWFRQNGQNLVSDDRYRVIVSHWDNHFSRFFGSKTVIDKRLQRRMSTYVEYRRGAKDKRTGKRKRAAASTLRLEIVSAKQLLKLAREHAHIGDDVGNLSIGIRRAKLALSKSRSTTFQDSEIDEIRDLFDREASELQQQIADKAPRLGLLEHQLFSLERLRFFVALSFASGARVNELRQVRHGDFGEDFKTLKIRKSKTRKGTNRTTFLDNEIWDIEQAYLRFKPYSLTHTKNGLVFVDKKGKVLVSAGQSFSEFLKRHRMLYDKVHGKRRRNLFAVRHYWITKQVNDSVSSFDVARSAGTSLKMIEETYYEDSPSALVENFEKQKGSRRQTRLRRVK